MSVSPLLISLKVSVLSTFFSFWVALLLVLFVQPRRKIQKAADTVMVIPTVISPTVSGFILLLIFGRNSPVGSMLNAIGLRVVFSVGGAVIASMCTGIPILYQAVRSAFDSVDASLLDDARTLGLTDLQFYAKVSLPVAFHYIRFGLIMAFARSMGEFGATIMVAGNIPGKTQTLTVAIYTAVQGGDYHTAFTWIGIMLLISFISVFAIRTFRSPS